MPKRTNITVRGTVKIGVLRGHLNNLWELADRLREPELQKYVRGEVAVIRRILGLRKDGQREPDAPLKAFRIIAEGYQPGICAAEHRGQASYQAILWFKGLSTDPEWGSFTKEKMGDVPAFRIQRAPEHDNLAQAQQAKGVFMMEG